MIKPTNKTLLEENEQLKKRASDLEASLAESEQRLRTLLEYTPEAIVMLDTNTGKFVDANENAQRLFGLDREALLQVGPLEFSPPTQADGRSSEEAGRAWIKEALDGNAPVFEWTHRNARQENVPCEVRLVIMPTAGRNVVRGSITDISERKRAQEALRRAHDELEKRVRQRTAALVESEARFRQIAENIREVFWLGATGKGQGKNLYVSPAYADIWGRTVESLQESPTAWLDAVHNHDREHVRQAAARLEEIGQYNIEYRIWRPDGTVRWIRDRAFPVKDDQGHILRIAGIAEDITDRKGFEQQLRAEEQLLRRLIDLQEQERRMIAHDIHDGFIQDVVGAHLHLQSIHGRLAASEIDAAVERISSLMKKAIAEGRRLIRGMRPIVLDEAGVIEAVRHLFADEQNHAGLTVAFEHDVRFDRLEPRLEGVVFRIIQEALNNVNHHSQTNHAAVRLTQHDDTLEVVVRDHGVGFDPKCVSPERFGLRGIRERARLFGGTAEIESSPGKGTTVRVKLPLEFADL